MLVRRVSSGQVVPLVAHLVQDRSMTRDEIRQLKALIAAAERRLKQEQARGAKS